MNISRNSNNGYILSNNYNSKDYNPDINDYLNNLKFRKKKNNSEELIEETEINKLIELVKMKNQHFLIPLKDLEKENKQQLINQDEINKNKKKIEDKKRKIRKKNGQNDNISIIRWCENANNSKSSPKKSIIKSNIRR